MEFETAQSVYEKELDEVDGRDLVYLIHTMRKTGLSFANGQFPEVFVYLRMPSSENGLERAHGHLNQPTSVQA
jgi:hypothetical protein